MEKSATLSLISLILLLIGFFLMIKKNYLIAVIASFLGIIIYLIIKNSNKS